MQTTSGDVPTFILPSILLMFCCCFPFGIVALTNGLKVKSHLSRGEYHSALEASAKARRQLKVGFVAGIAAAFAVMLLELLFSVG